MNKNRLFLILTYLEALNKMNMLSQLEKQDFQNIAYSFSSGFIVTYSWKSPENYHMINKF